MAVKYTPACMALFSCIATLGHERLDKLLIFVPFAKRTILIDVAKTGADVSAAAGFHKPGLFLIQILRLCLHKGRSEFKSEARPLLSCGLWSRF